MVSLVICLLGKRHVALLFSIDVLHFATGKSNKDSPDDCQVVLYDYPLVNYHSNGLSLVSIGNTSSEGPF